MFVLLAIRPLFHPLFRWRVGQDLTVERVVDLGLAGLVDALIHGRSSQPVEPPSSPEADAIADAFHNLRQERSAEQGS